MKTDHPHEGHQPLIQSLYQNVAVWQGMSFILILGIIWVNEVLDLPHLLYDIPATPIDWIGASMLSAGVIISAFIMVGNTFVQQQNVLKGFILVCSCCKRVKLEEKSWEQLEQFVAGRTLAEFSHGICPECYHASTSALGAPGEPVTNAATISE